MIELVVLSRAESELQRIYNRLIIITAASLQQDPASIRAILDDPAR